MHTEWAQQRPAAQRCLGRKRKEKWSGTESPEIQQMYGRGVPLAFNTPGKERGSLMAWLCEVHTLRSSGHRSTVQNRRKEVGAVTSVRGRGFHFHLVEALPQAAAVLCEVPLWRLKEKIVGAVTSVGQHHLQEHRRATLLSTNGELLLLARPEILLSIPPLTGMPPHLSARPALPA